MSVIRNLKEKGEKKSVIPATPATPTASRCRGSLLSARCCVAAMSLRCPLRSEAVDVLFRAVAQPDLRSLLLLDF
jgi:hypothetical protein